MTQSSSSNVKKIVEQARIAQQAIRHYSQQQLDELTHAVAWALMKPEHNQRLSEMAVAETGLGNVADKITKNHRKTLGLLRDLQNKKTTGQVADYPELGITEFARPLGVIGALIPSTNPVATPVNKIINSLKCANAIVLAPSPKGANVLANLIELIDQEFSKINAPKHLVQQLPIPPTKQQTAELMQLVDLVVVTGSQNNVRNAYSSGTQAIGVGTGNVTTIIDSSADFAQASTLIRQSKTFDNATSCSSENNLICYQKDYSKMIQALTHEGGYLLNQSQKQQLQQNFFPDNHLNTQLIAKDAKTIADACHIKVPENTRFLMVDETSLGADIPFSRERMAPILTVYQVADFAAAIHLAEQLLLNQGAGHSVGIHTNDPNQTTQLATILPTCRVIENQAHCFAAGGSFDNGLPFSLSMGCGSWGKNSISENLHYKHYLNQVRIVRKIPPNEPTVEDVLGHYINRFG